MNGENPVFIEVVADEVDVSVHRPGPQSDTVAGWIPARESHAALRGSTLGPLSPLLRFEPWRTTLSQEIEAGYEARITGLSHLTFWLFQIMALGADI